MLFGENLRMQVQAAGVGYQAAQVLSQSFSPVSAAKAGKSGQEISPTQLQGCAFSNQPWWV